jgi:hypothetical protein
MALQYGVLLRNAQLDAIESTIGVTPILTIRTGAPPADCATANAGTVLATINLPSDWMAAAAAGVKAISGGPWTDASADAAGTAGHFRIHNSANTVCHMQGTVGTSASDMIVDNVVFAAGQSFSINTFSITAGNP